MRTAAFLTSLLAFSTYTSAWAWPQSLNGGKALRNIEQMLYGRQNNNGNSNPRPGSVAAIVSTAAPTTRAPSSTQQSRPGSSASSTAAKSGSIETGHPAKSQTSGSSAKPSTTLLPINPQDPAGAVAMITPAPLLGAQYYKIGDNVTFAWNYTDLLRTPSGIDILASLSQSAAGGNTATFTLAQNMTYDPTATFTWDTNDWTSSATPLAPGSYTLIIYDAGAGVSATAQPGYLGTYEQFTFGMYTPAAYTALAPEYQCATCNAGLSQTERMTLGFLFAMAGITVISFTWFATGSGVLF